MCIYIVRPSVCVCVCVCVSDWAIQLLVYSDDLALL